MRVQLTLRFKIMLLIILVINLLLSVIGLIIINYIREFETRQLKKNAMDIAQSTARNPTIAENIGLEGGIEIIQSIADGIRKSTSADYIVVIGMDRISYSHPYQERLGEQFKGGDELNVLKEGKSYLAQGEAGNLGPSIRAFAPIFRDDEQVGAVSVGILLEDVKEIISSITRSIIFALIIGDILGIISSIFLANNVKKSIFGLEPIEIAKLLQEKNAIIDSIKEGIIAIDSRRRITLANKEAKKILNFKGELKGQDISKVITNTRLHVLLKTGRPEYNKEQVINGTLVLTNLLPIKVKDKVVGAVVSFKRKDTVQRLAEELTGVKKYADALRSQNHEFMNYLHTISGLIQLGEYENTVKLISRVTHQKQKITSFIIKKIKINEIAGLLLGKIERANELKIKTKIDPNSSLSYVPSRQFKDSLITIIGNLLENAIESLNYAEIKHKKIYLGLFETQDYIKLIVRDTGIGIDPAFRERVFERGFSTKDGEDRGIGLYLVKSNLEIFDGEIKLKSKPGQGSTLTVIMPYPKKRGEDSGTSKHLNYRR